MPTQTIIPDYVIELNPDYSLANHSIDTNVCRYINSHRVQRGGSGCESAQVEGTSGRKFFTPDALRFLNMCSLSPDEVLDNLAFSIGNTSITNFQFGGGIRKNKNKKGKKQGKNKTKKSKKKKRTYKQVPKYTVGFSENDTEFLENYSGDKEDKRLVYLIRFGGQTVVAKIMNGDKKALKEKYLYRFFNEKAKRDQIVKKQILRSYDTEDFVREHIDQPSPYVILPCTVNGIKYNVKLNNDVIPVNNQGESFLKTSSIGTAIGTYNRVNELYAQCSYLVVEVRQEFSIYKEYVKGDPTPKVLKEIITKTDQTLAYLNSQYRFNHWDLHYNNLLIDINPNTPTDICLFDFDLSAGGDYSNVDAYIRRLQKYIDPEHNLYESYLHMKIEPSEVKNIPADVLDENQKFEAFLRDNLSYQSFDLDAHLAKFNSPRKLETYFQYMGRMMDLMRLMDISKEHLRSVNFSKSNKITKECLVVYRLVYLCDINSHRRMSYCTLLFAEYLLSAY
jgi:hypothetical protein